MNYYIVRQSNRLDSSWRIVIRSQNGQYIGYIRKDLSINENISGGYAINPFKTSREAIQALKKKFPDVKKVDKRENPTDIWFEHKKNDQL